MAAAKFSMTSSLDLHEVLAAMVGAKSSVTSSVDFLRKALAGMNDAKSSLGFKSLSALMFVHFICP